jgi:methionine aminopeptidase
LPDVTPATAHVLKKGDIINMELAAGYRGYTAQVGSPICVGDSTEMAQNSGTR